jgi:acetyltransferase-like isoleucine patch superfamily enzyme
MLYKAAKTAQRMALTAMVTRQAKRTGSGLRVNGWSSVSRFTTLGNNVHFNGLIVSGSGEVTIGDNFHSGKGCLFLTENHDFDSGDALPYGQGRILKPIVIGDNVWLGSRVIVLGGVTIGEGAVIQAGSCVVSDIPACAVAGGHPAKVFSQRDLEHYERLKREGKAR